MHSSPRRSPRATRRAAALATILLASAVARPAHAQRVLGIGDDAVGLPRGTVRVRVLGSWTSFDQRYGLGTPGRRAGALEPVSVDLSLDTLGVVQFPALGAVQQGLRELTGIGDFGVTLGRTVATSDVRITATPVVLELGVTRRLTLSAVVPFVRTRHTVSLDVNPAGTEGNLGFNPAASSRAARDANALVQAQFRAAATRLSGLLTACAAPAVAGQPQCAPLNANRAGATALVQQATAFAAGVGRIYGDSAAAGSLFVPIAGTDAQLAVQARVAAFSRQFSQFGVGDLGTATFPAASAARLGAEDVQTILADEQYGLAAAPAETIERTGLGDVEIAGQFKLLDSFGANERARFDPRGFNYRSAVTGAVRVGTGSVDLPTNFLDVGTGTGANAVSLRSATDLLYGRRFWVTVVGRYTAQLRDRQSLRITERPEQVLAARFREQQVERDLGDVVELELTPRYVLTDYFAVSAQYYYRRKAQDRYTGTFSIDSATTGYGAVTLDASTLDQETEAREHRAGAGVSFSTLAAFDRGRARLPIEISYYHFQTLRGAGGNVPKLFGDQLQLRVYFRVFGR